MNDTEPRFPDMSKPSTERLRKIAEIGSSGQIKMQRELHGVSGPML
ncbi:MAG: hypothetical protein U5K69_11295 [Balneolaceae bacterium]|nr:hypothetical protein [Balneolaceae bacterium]